MSTTAAILKAIADNPGATSEEIAEASGIEHVKVRNTLSVIGSPSQGPLVSRALDDVTGKPGYTLTERGRQALAKNAPGAKPDAKPAVATHTADGRQVEAGAKNPKGKPEDSPAPPAPHAGHPGGDVGITYDEVRASLLLTELRERVRELEANCELLKSRLSSERKAGQALQKQLDAAPAVDVHAVAMGYAVYSAKLKRPIRRDTAEGAKDAALSHARSRSSTAHVYALVPIGTAKVGAEWRGA